MGSSGGGEEEKVPWKPQADQLHQFYQAAGESFNTPKQLFPGSTIAGRGDSTMLARSMADEFLTGNRPADAANAFIGDTLSGTYMDGNPERDAMFDQMSSKIREQYETTVMPGIQSRYAGAGQSNSSGYEAAVGRSQGELGDSLSDAATSVYYQDYEARMGDRFKAAGMLPQVQAATFGDIGLASSIGAEDDQYSQSLLDESVNRFMYNQNEPEARLDQFGQRIGADGVSSNFGTTSISGGGGNAGLSSGLGILSLIGQLGSAYFTGGASIAASAGSAVTGGSASLLKSLGM